MVRIAIVEDDQAQAVQLENAIRQYSADYDLPLKITQFHNAMAFLGNYSAEFDLIFMDIMMPMMNGMDAARALREKDDKVMLIFVTNMQQFAIQGYEVGAFDFIVKPVAYGEFRIKFTRALTRLQTLRQQAHIRLKTEDGFVKLLPRQIRYVEVQSHHCIYHTTDGDYRQYQTMKSAQAQLEGQGFCRCNNFLLVNLFYVTKMEGMNVHLGDTVLQVSYPRKKAFTDALEQYLRRDV